MKVLVNVQDVNQTFMVGGQPETILKHVDFSITANSFNIIYGPSGSGKSTLLNVMSGLQKPTSGTVAFEDKDIYNLSADEVAHFRASRIGIVYQTNYWVKSLNVVENVAMPLFFLGYPRAGATKIAMNALDQVAMTEYAKQYPIFLSGGEQQRIAMARAIVTDPLFVIADEPTGNLDSKNGDMIMNQLRVCQEHLKRTIILVTHNIEYLPLADRLLHIEDGHVNEIGHDAIPTLIQQMRDRIDALARSKKYEANV